MNPVSLGMVNKRNLANSMANFVSLAEGPYLFSQSNLDALHYRLDELWSAASSTSLGDADKLAFDLIATFIDRLTSLLEQLSLPQYARSPRQGRASLDHAISTLRGAPQPPPSEPSSSSASSRVTKNRGKSYRKPSPASQRLSASPKPRKPRSQRRAAPPARRRFSAP